MTMPPAPSLSGEDPTPPAKSGRRWSAEALSAWRAEGKGVIGLIGFSTAGKTWFLNRLKTIYQSRDPHLHLFRETESWDVDPEPIRDGRLGLRTNDTEDHSFKAPDSEAERSFVIRDMAGERIELAADARDQRSADVPAFARVDTFVADLLVCDALIIVLPAEAALLGPTVVDDARKQVLSALNSGDEPSEEDLEAVGAPPSEAELDTGPLRADLKRLRASRDDALKREDGAKKDADIAALNDEIDRVHAEILRLERWKLALDTNMMESFLSNFGTLGNVIRILEVRPDAAALAAMSRDEIFRQPDGKPRMPVMICLARADTAMQPDEFMKAMIHDAARRLLEQETRSADIDEDAVKARTKEILKHLKTIDRHPVEIANAMSRAGGKAPGLGRSADRFSWCKVDFVTAFWGHDRTLSMRYSKHHYGVQGVTDFIDWAKGLRRANRFVRASVDHARFLRRLKVIGRPEGVNPFRPKEDDGRRDPVRRWIASAPAAAVKALFEGESPFALVATVLALAGLVLAAATLPSLVFRPGGADDTVTIMARGVYPATCDAIRETTTELRPSNARSRRPTELQQAIRSHRCDAVGDNAATAAERLSEAVEGAGQGASSAWDRAAALSMLGRKSEVGDAVRLLSPEDADRLMSIIRPTQGQEDLWGLLARAEDDFEFGRIDQLREAIATSPREPVLRNYVSQVVDRAIDQAETSNNRVRAQQLRASYGEFLLVSQGAERRAMATGVLGYLALMLATGSLLAWSLLVRASYRRLYRPRHFEDMEKARRAAR